MRIVGNNRYQKEANALLILNLLRRGPCSRARIARELGLQSSTVTYSVARLLEVGSVAEVPADRLASETSGRVGRKPSGLTLNPGFGRVAGVEMMSALYRVYIGDISGVSVFREERPYAGGRVSGTPDRFRDLVSEVIDRVLFLCGETPLLGVCIAVPGIVDEENTCIRECWTHGLEHVRFADFLSAFPFPVIFENDANCCAIKYLFNDDDRHECFCYLQSRRHRPEAVPEGIPTIGIGLGMVVDGALMRGASSRAGEYRSGELMGTGKGGQVALDAGQLDRLDDDPATKRLLVRKLFSDIFCLVSVFDPRFVYVGGFLASSPYREIVGDVLENDLNDFWLRERWTGEMLMVHDTLYDPAEGAADALLDFFYRVPQVGNSQSGRWHWDALFSGMS